MYSRTREGLPEILHHHRNAKRGSSLSIRQDAIDKARERYGVFILISNEVKDPLTALRLYRTQNVVEKAFWDIKDRLNMRRTLVSSEVHWKESYLLNLWH